MYLLILVLLKAVVMHLYPLHKTKDFTDLQSVFLLSN